MQKSLDAKIARILADRSCRDFVIADAKDADMAFGLSSPGKSPEHHANEAQFRSLDDYRVLIRQVIEQGLVDIVLMSASTSEILTLGERLFDNSHITPAVRANDTSDIWLAAGSGRYGSQPSRPFRTATLDHIMCGKPDCTPGERSLGADLGLYSVTYNNDVELDHRALEAYNAFRLEAERKGFRHFLEVFDPNAPGEHPPEDVGQFISDHIVRTLAGVTSGGRPVFLKIPYHGPAAMEALAGYDSSLVVGILGGSSGTTFDAYHMLWEAKKYGARVALYGRKINSAEHQLAFIHHLRSVADDAVGPAEAVKAYHGDLGKMGIKPYRTLDQDLERTYGVTSYSGRTSATPSSRPQGAVSTQSADEPDFSRMTQAEKVQWNLDRWKRIIG